MDKGRVSDEILPKLNIADVVGSYVKLSKAGRGYKGLCPFHNEATPSFVVTPSKGLFKCFGCGEGGNVIAFVSKVEGISYSQALVKLAKKVGVTSSRIESVRFFDPSVKFEKEYEILNFAKGFFEFCLKNTNEGQAALDYLNARGIEQDIVSRFGIGLAPRDSNALIKALELNGYDLELAKRVGLINSNEFGGGFYSLFRTRVIFPVSNEFGQVTGFSGRIYLSSDKSFSKYVNSPDTPLFKKNQLVYNLHEAKRTARSTGRFLLFEGFMDVISAVRAGFSESVAMMGTSLTREHVALIKKVAPSVVICYDGDRAGLEATNKTIALLLEEGVDAQVVSVPDGRDPDEFIKTQGGKAFSGLVNAAVPAVDYVYGNLKANYNLNFAQHKAEFQKKVLDFAGTLQDPSLRYFLEKRLRGDLFYTKAEETPSPTIPARSVANGYSKSERQLLYHMLTSKRAFEMVHEEINCDFNIDDYRKIARWLEDFYARHDVIDIEACFEKFDTRLKDVVNQIMLTHRNIRPATDNEILALIKRVRDKAKDEAEKLSVRAKMGQIKRELSRQ